MGNFAFQLLLCVTLDLLCNLALRQNTLEHLSLEWADSVCTSTISVIWRVKQEGALLK